MIIVNMILSVIGIAICYYLALAYIGVSKSLKETWLPIILFSILTVLSKVYLHVPAFFHTCLLGLFCAFFLHFINKINPLESLIGSLLSFITVTLASLLFALPVVQKLGVKLSFSPKMNDFSWILINLAEFIAPLLVLIILKVKKISIMKLTT